MSDFVTTRQAAKMLGVAPDHINLLLIAKKLSGVKPGGRYWMIHKSSIENYFAHKSRRGRPTSKTPTLKAA